MNSPLFSVIVPMYNVEEYARQCIESILNQSFCDFELILVDDGAKDSTPQIIDEYAQKDERIIAIHKQNGGVTAARKSGLRKACGRYIVLVDGDDWIHPDHLLKFSEAILSDPVIDLVCCNYFVAEKNKKAKENKEITQSGYYDRAFLEENIFGELFSFPPHLWAKAFRKPLYEKYQEKIDDIISLGEDGMITFCALLDTQLLYVVEDCLYYYRYNPGSITKNRKKEWSTDGLLARVKMLENELGFEKYNLHSQFVAYVSHVTINQCLSYFRANPYKIAKMKTKDLLKNGLISKYIHKKVKIPNKKERIAKFALKHRWCFAIKIYSLFN